MAQFTNITEAYTNQAPTTVGDGTETTAYGNTIVYTRAMFTTNTTPPYSDPEGDAALNLKVITLPTIGTLQLNAVNVTLNQIISFADIDSGLFTYIPDNGTQVGYTDPFDFQIADAGSGIFVG